jgi:hypothetical protein
MKRILVIKIAALCICLASPAFAQFRANSFSKPAIAEAVNPVVGKGGQYQTIHSGQSGTSSELQEFTVVGKEMVDGKEGFWLEIVHQGKGNSGLRYAKVLFTKDDFQFHKMIVQQPGQQPWAPSPLPFRRERFPANTGKKASPPRTAPVTSGPTQKFPLLASSKK